MIRTLKRTLTTFLRDESGYVMSAELALLGTVAGVGLVAGLSSAQDAMNAELDNVAGAFRSMDQSFGHRGFKRLDREGQLKSWTANSFFFDEEHKEKNAEFIEQHNTEEGRYVEIDRCEKKAPELVKPREVHSDVANEVELVPPRVDTVAPPVVDDAEPVAPKFDQLPSFPVAPRQVEQAQPEPLGSPSVESLTVPCETCPPMVTRLPSYAPLQVCPPGSRIRYATPRSTQTWPAYPPGYVPNSLPINPLASPAGPQGLVW